MFTVMAQLDEETKRLHNLLQQKLNFTDEGIPLPRKERGYVYSREARHMIRRLAQKNGINT